MNLLLLLSIIKELNEKSMFIEIYCFCQFIDNSRTSFVFIFLNEYNTLNLIRLLEPERKLTYPV